MTSRAILCLLTAYAAACGAPAWVAVGLVGAWGVWRYAGLSETEVIR